MNPNQPETSVNLCQRVIRENTGGTEHRSQRRRCVCAGSRTEIIDEGVDPERGDEIECD
jgi:hypothetical protein